MTKNYIITCLLISEKNNGTEIILQTKKRWGEKSEKRLPGMIIHFKAEFMCVAFWMGHPHFHVLVVLPLTLLLSDLKGFAHAKTGLPSSQTLC